MKQIEKEIAEINRMRAAIKNTSSVSIYDTLCVADFYFNGDYEEAGCNCDAFDCVKCERCWKREIKNE